MEVSSISPQGISAQKQVQAQSEAGVRLENRANEQQKAVAATLIEGVKERTPEPGKGALLDKVA